MGKIQIDRIAKFIRSYIHEAKAKYAIVGISGGIDSAVVAALAARALGSNRVHGIMMPFKIQTDIKDSEDIIKKLKINGELISITPMVESFQHLEEELPTKIVHDQIRYGNVMARCRMICLYDRSKKYNALVLGTCNKSELLMGYFTKHGDGACDIEPIAHLYKTEIRELAKILKIPKNIINKVPSAGLWEGQTDEEELGISYDNLDEIFIRSEAVSWKSKLPLMLERD